MSNPSEAKQYYLLLLLLFRDLAANGVCVSSQTIWIGEQLALCSSILTILESFFRGIDLVMVLDIDESISSMSDEKVRHESRILQRKVWWM
jgi:hypothetical protein